MFHSSTRQTTKTRTNQPTARTAAWRAPSHDRKKGERHGASDTKRNRPQVTIGRLHEAFEVDCDPTMGVELEFFLVDKTTGEPTPVFERVRDRLPAEIRENTIYEFLQCQIEYATPICRDAEECRIYLQRFIDAASDAAAKEGAELLWRATLEDWKFDPAMIYDCPRSRENVRRLGDRAQNLSTCGMHVHVAVPQRNAIDVVDQMQLVIPDVVRQSANSPTMHGRDGVIASQRAKIWGCEFPMLTFPDYFGDWSQFRTQIARLSRFGKVQQPKDLYMLARPTSHGTVELRAADLPKDLDTAIDIANQIQTSVINCQIDPQPLPTLQELWARYQAAYLGDAGDVKASA